MQYICLLCQRMDKMAFSGSTEPPGGDAGWIQPVTIIPPPPLVPLTQSLSLGPQGLPG